MQGGEKYWVGSKKGRSMWGSLILGVCQGSVPGRLGWEEEERGERRRTTDDEQGRGLSAATQSQGKLPGSAALRNQERPLPAGAHSRQGTRTLPDPRWPVLTRHRQGSNRRGALPLPPLSLGKPLSFCACSPRLDSGSHFKLGSRRRHAQ